MVEKHPFSRRIAAAAMVLGALALSGVVPQPAIAEAPVTDKWITIVLESEPSGLDPCMSNRVFEGRFVKYNINEPLIQKNPDGALKPRLATSWEQVDPSTWRIKLRQGVTFHDGTPFNAENAKKSLERNWNKPLVCGDKAKFFSDINIEVTPLDANTLQIKTDRPTPILPTLLTGLVIGGPATSPDKLLPAGAGPVGTGPYVFDSWQGGQQILLKRNDTYWGVKPVVEGVRYVWRNESSVRAAMVKIGEADIGLNLASQDATDPDMDYSYLNSETSLLRIDTELPPMNDKRVRLALNYALDLDSIRGSVLPKSIIRATQIVFPSIPGHNQDLDKRARPFDPAKAKQLLAEAKADGVPVDREMLLAYNPGLFANAGEVMEAYLAMYKAVGLNIKGQVVDAAQQRRYGNKPFPEGRPPVLLATGHDNNFGDPMFSVFFKYGCDGVASAYCNPELDKEVLRVSSLGGEARVKGWQDIMRYLYDEAVADVPLYHMVGFTRVAKRVRFVPDTTTYAEIRVEEMGFK